MKENSIRRMVPVAPWIAFEGPVMIRHIAAANAPISFGSIAAKDLNVDRKEASGSIAGMMDTPLFESLLVES